MVSVAIVLAPPTTEVWESGSNWSSNWQPLVVRGDLTGKGVWLVPGTTSTLV